MKIGIIALGVFLSFPFSGFAEEGCAKIFKLLQSSTPSASSKPLNLKMAQEIAEPFVSRSIASEVLTDPGVEMAMEHAAELNQFGALPFGQNDAKFQIVAEAIEEALLTRGMSPGQAKRAAQGWTKAMLKQGVLPD